MTPMRRTFYVAKAHADTYEVRGPGGKTYETAKLLNYAEAALCAKALNEHAGSNDGAVIETNAAYYIMADALGLNKA